MKKKLKPGKSHIHGTGLFTTEFIRQGTILGTCKVKKSKEENEHTLWVDDKKVEVTCRLKYINHSASPNVAYYEDLTVVALQDISAGEELTHHYGDGWD